MSETLGDAAVPERDRSRREGPGDKHGERSGERRSLPARMALFYRQVLAEMRKVIWPTRTELITYTWVVIVFVVVIAAIVGVLDYIFAKGVLKVFGS